MINLDLHDDVAVVTLAHGKANALDLELCRHVSNEFPALTESARAVVLTGRGKIFSAGVDLLRVLNEDADYARRFIDALGAFCEALFSYPKPLIAAINGHAIAGGCVLACMADRRLMARGIGRIGVPELLVGVPFPAAPLEVLRFALPQQHFADVIYGCQTYDADAALERGLIDEVVEADTLLEHAVEIARGLGALAPSAFRLTKAQWRQPALDRMRTGAASDAAVREMWAAPDTKAAIRAYVSQTFKPAAR